MGDWNNDTSNMGIKNGFDLSREAEEQQQGGAPTVPISPQEQAEQTLDNSTPEVPEEFASSPYQEGAVPTPEQTTPSDMTAEGAEWVSTIGEETYEQAGEQDKTKQSMNNEEGDDWTEKAYDAVASTAGTLFKHIASTSAIGGVPQAAGVLSGAVKETASLAKAANHYLSEVGKYVTGDKEYDYANSTLFGQLFDKDSDINKMKAPSVPPEYMNALAGELAINPSEDTHPVLKSIMDMGVQEDVEVAEAVGKFAADVYLSRFVPLGKPFEAVANTKYLSHASKGISSTVAPSMKKKAVAGALKGVGEGLKFSTVEGGAELGRGTDLDTVFGTAISRTAEFGAFGAAMPALGVVGKAGMQMFSGEASAKKGFKELEVYTKKALAEKNISYADAIAERVRYSIYDSWDAMPMTERILYLGGASKGGRKMLSRMAQDTQIAEAFNAIEHNTAGAIKKEVQGVDSLTGTQAVNKGDDVAAAVVHEAEITALLRNHGFEDTSSAYQAVEGMLDRTLTGITEQGAEAVGKAIGVLDGTAVGLEKQLLAQSSKLKGVEHRVNTTDFFQGIINDALPNKLAGEVKAEARVLNEAFADIFGVHEAVNLTPTNLWKVLKRTRQIADKALKDGEQVQFAKLRDSMLNSLDKLYPEMGFGTTLRRLDGITHAKKSMLERNDLATLMNADKLAPAEIQTALSRLGMQDSNVYKQVIGNIKGADRVKVELAVIKAKVMKNLEDRAKYSIAGQAERQAMQADSKGLLNRADLFNPADAVTKEGKELATYLHQVGKYTDGIVTSLPTLEGEKVLKVHVWQKVNNFLELMYGRVANTSGRTEMIENSAFLENVMTNSLKMDKKAGTTGQVVTKKSVKAAEVFKAEHIDPSTIFAVQSLNALRSMGSHLDNPNMPSIETLMYGRTKGVQTMTPTQATAVHQEQYKAVEKIVGNEITYNIQTKGMMVPKDKAYEVSRALAETRKGVSLTAAPDGSINTIIGEGTVIGLNSQHIKEAVDAGVTKTFYAADVLDTSALRAALEPHGIPVGELRLSISRDMDELQAAKLSHRESKAPTVVINADHMEDMNNAQLTKYVAQQLSHEVTHLTDTYMNSGIVAGASTIKNQAKHAGEMLSEKLTGHTGYRTAISTLSDIAEGGKANISVATSPLIQQLLKKAGVGDITKKTVDEMLVGSQADTAKNILQHLGNAKGVPNMLELSRQTNEAFMYKANLGEINAGWVESLWQQSGKMDSVPLKEFIEGNKQEIDFLWRTGYTQAPPPMGY